MFYIFIIITFSVNIIDIDDSIRPLPTNSLELRERIKRGAYRPILSVYPCAQQNGRNRSFRKE